MPKKTIKIAGYMKTKLFLLFVFVVIGLIALTCKIIYIQKVSGAAYEKIVLSQQEYDSETIPCRRGDILDAKGTILASSTDVYNLVLDIKVMTSKDSYVEPTLAALFSCFPELSEEDIRKLVKDNPNSPYQVLLKQLPFSRKEAFTTFQTESKDGSKIKGVWFEKQYIRSYPYGSLASAVIGFTGSEGEGVQGLESYYNDVLSGTNGRRYGYLNSDDDLEKTTKDAVDGDTIVSTVDANLQSIVESKIKEFWKDFKNLYREGNAAENIGVIIMNPKDGSVMSMAEYPTYDINNPRDLSVLFTEEEMENLSSDEKVEALNRLWSNFCVSSTYEPGSTAKPFTVACGLETGTVNENDTFVCDGYEQVSDHKIYCVNRYGHGTETVRKALMDSCNDALMQMSYKIGADNFTSYQNVFGFGLKTNIDLPAEARTDSLIYKSDNMKKVDLATNSFGQNFNTTMIQLAGAFSSLINDGYYYQPHIVSSVLDASGTVKKTVEPVLIKQTVSASTSETMRDYLKSVVDEGTAKTVKVNGYSMGGKTGTAEKSTASGKDKENYLVSFIGFLPADDPKLLIYTVIDSPNAPDQAHSLFAQNVTREILEEALPYLNMFPDEELNPDLPSKEDTNMFTGLSPYLSIPDIPEDTEGTEN